MPIVALVLILAAVIGGILYFRAPETSVPPVNTPPTEIPPPSSAQVPADAMTTGELPTTAPDTDTTPSGAPPKTPAASPETATPVVGSTPPAKPTRPVAVSGTFTTNTTYLTPKRTSHALAVTLTVTNDVVTAATVRYDNKDGFSNSYQERFDADYKTQVVGKKLSDISLSRVGGASLTSNSFNEAIKDAQAQTAS